MTEQLSRSPSGRIQLDASSHRPTDIRPGSPQIFPDIARGGWGRIAVDAERPALVYVPEGHDPACESPLLVMLHGAGGTAQGALGLVMDEVLKGCDFLVVAPQSRGKSWDLTRGKYQSDPAHIAKSIRAVARHFPVNLRHLALAGFSDGGSYALSLGLTNGDVFPYVIAFSPGFAVSQDPVGTPKVFIAHGIDDEVLPINSCSRRLVPRLRAEHYDVVYREFKGRHEVPAPIVREAFNWFRAQGEMRYLESSL